jgi:site-specific DNA-methyltransferase (adenine-specific)
LAKIYRLENFGPQAQDCSDWRQYRVIYADPPWKFSSGELQTYGGERFTSIEKHYPVQSVEWIKSLPVERIAMDDAALFLWTTDAHMKEAIEVIEAWGFRYVTVSFIWEKVSVNGKTLCTLGAWTLKNYEQCLLGTRGTMLQYKEINNIRQKVVAQRGKHSEKPEEVRHNIEQLFGDCQRIELFARGRVAGWDAWGNEV